MLLLLPCVAPCKRAGWLFLMDPIIASHSSYQFASSFSCLGSLYTILAVIFVFCSFSLLHRPGSPRQSSLIYPAKIFSPTHLNLFLNQSRSNRCQKERQLTAKYSPFIGWLVTLVKARQDFCNISASHKITAVYPLATITVPPGASIGEGVIPSQSSSGALMGSYNYVYNMYI